MALKHIMEIEKLKEIKQIFADIEDKKLEIGKL